MNRYHIALNKKTPLYRKLSRKLSALYKKVTSIRLFDWYCKITGRTVRNSNMNTPSAMTTRSTLALNQELNRIMEMPTENLSGDSGVNYVQGDSGVAGGYNQGGDWTGSTGLQGLSRTAYLGAE